MYMHCKGEISMWILLSLSSQLYENCKNKTIEMWKYNQRYDFNKVLKDMFFSKLKPLWNVNGEKSQKFCLANLNPFICAENSSFCVNNAAKGKKKK
jgi:hypothetical protein